MRTLTVDDRRSVVNMMLRILDKIDQEGEHIGTTDPEKALKVIREKEVTAVYVDVEMPKINGIELARMMQEVKPETNIIFITGYQEYMPDAFELYASGYLMKPVDEDDVRKSLEHLRYKGEPI
ncbi:MAG: response regulator, partial [Erysipelotrichaceae bacterium]|nr:response regulator [Erysipelotrichaceae bacterium]